MKRKIIVAALVCVFSCSLAYGSLGMAKKITFVTDGLGGTKTFLLDEIDLSKFQLLSCIASSKGWFLFPQFGTLSDDSNPIYNFNGNYDGAEVGFSSDQNCSNPVTFDNISYYKISLRNPIVFTYSASLTVFVEANIAGVAILETPNGSFKGKVTETY